MLCAVLKPKSRKDAETNDPFLTEDFRRDFKSHSCFTSKATYARLAAQMAKTRQFIKVCGLTGRRATSDEKIATVGPVNEAERSLKLTGQVAGYVKKPQAKGIVSYQS